MRPYKLYILDLDGTLYRGDSVIPGALETVEELRHRGALIRYLTNNSGQTRDAYVGKLKRMGFKAEPAEIYSSATGTARYLLESAIHRVFTIGEIGLVKTLRDARIDVMNADVSGTVQPSPHSGAEAIVVGICRALTYDLLNGALQQSLAGARIIATNTDATYPVEQGHVIPGAGAVVAAVQTCTGQAPAVIGKPNPYLVQLVLKEAGIDPADALAVGDRYETDILSGQAAGTDTHLVLTGVTQSAPEGQSSSEDLRGLL